MATTLKIKPPVEPRALRSLRALPGIDVVVTDEAGRGWLVEFKADVRTSDARAITDRLSEQGAPGILVAEHITGEARALLHERGVGAVDATGYAHLDLPGVFVHVDRPAPPRPRGSDPRLRGRTAAVAIAMLLDPERPWKLIDLAERAGASVSLVHRTVAYLERRGLVQSEGRGRARVRRVVAPGGVLDLLAEDADWRHVRAVPAYRFAQTLDETIGAVTATLRDAGVRCALTGIAAANLLAPHLTNVGTATFWVAASAALEPLFETLDAQPTAQGANLVLAQARDDGPLAFSREHAGLPLANVIQVYLDARREPQRGIEQAEHLRKEAIGF